MKNILVVLTVLTFIISSQVFASNHSNTSSKVSDSEIVTLTATDLDAFFTAANGFFRKYVANGSVAYSKLRGNGKDLNALLKQISQADLSDASSTVKQAFYINAYNLLVIKSIVKHNPKSPLDVSGFFNTEKHSVAGASTTLDQLEKETLMGLKKDARFHFVLVCGAKGCPQLASFAYIPSRLETQLARQTKLALNDDSFIKVKDGKVEVSELFKWYTSDFTTNGKSIVDYINQYRSSKISSDATVDYYSYNWTVNGR